MTRVPAIGTAPPLLALALALLLSLMVFPSASSLARQEEDPAPIVAGAGPVREQSLALTGRNRYGEDTIEIFGYLTAVTAIERDLLVSDPDAASPSPQTARFTYAGSVAIASRGDRADVTAITGEGVLRVYLHPGDGGAGASWDDPGSFAAGEPVAEYALRLAETLQRQAPGVGVLVGDGQLTQDRASEFSLAGERYRFGADGIAQRLRYVGSPLATGAQPDLLEIALTGSTSVVAREAIAVSVGAPAPAATPAASPVASVAAECPALQPWLDETRNALSEARALAALGRDGDPAALDAEALRQAVAQLAALGQTRRESAPPESAFDANRLVVTALSTYARALEVIASAAADPDPALLAQGQAVLADGDQLLQRAEESVAALVSAC